MVNKKISSKIKNKIGTDVESGVVQMTTRLPVALAERPVGRSKSPSNGHFKIPHPDARLMVQ